MNIRKYHKQQETKNNINMIYDKKIIIKRIIK